MIDHFEIWLDEEGFRSLYESKFIGKVFTGVLFLLIYKLAWG